MQYAPSTALIALLLAAWPAVAQDQPPPAELPPPALEQKTARDPEDKVFKEVGVDEKLGSRPPLELVFTDHLGRPFRPADALTGGPVILTLNFYECPMLCPMAIHNLAESVAALKGLSPERDFRLVTLSFNPDETLAEAKKTAGRMHGLVPGLAHGDERWPFLIGSAENITAFTRAVGFRYKRLSEHDFAHPNAILVLTPQGTISRYLYGLKIEPRDLRLALLEAADGKIGDSPLLNQAVLFCFDYDPKGRQYVLFARRVMAAGGVLTLLGLGVLYLFLGRSGRKAAA